MREETNGSAPNRTAWSEAELDEALEFTHADARAGTAPIAQLRVRVLTHIEQNQPVSAVHTAATTIARAGGGGRRFPLPWVSLAAAAAAATLVGGFVLHAAPPQPQQSPSGTGRAQGGVEMVSASLALTSAAELAIETKDQPLKPGQYRYVDVHAWWETTTQSSSNTGFSYLREELVERWIPADYHDVWLERRTSTGKKKWIGGTEPESVMNQPEKGDDIQDGDRKGPCGDFFPQATPKKVCGDPRDWNFPEFYASLPKDPDQLLALWNKDYANAKTGSASVILHNASQMLATGQVPADVRAVMYRVLAKLPGITITDRAANLDGVTGVALGIDDGRSQRDEVVIDRKTGQYLGDRQVVTHADQPWIKPGTVTGFTSQTTTVVDNIGVRPAG